MVLYGISGFKPIKLPPKIEAGDTARKPLKPLCTIHIVCAQHELKHTHRKLMKSVKNTNLFFRAKKWVNNILRVKVPYRHLVKPISKLQGGLPRGVH